VRQATSLGVTISGLTITNGNARGKFFPNVRGGGLTDLNFTRFILAPPGHLQPEQAIPGCRNHR